MYYIDPNSESPILYRLMRKSPTASFIISPRLGLTGPASFGDPLETWTATTLEEVRQTLDRVQKSQAAGQYVVGYIAYEAAPAFDACAAHSPSTLPFTWFASFEGPTDHRPPVTEIPLRQSHLRLTIEEYRMCAERVLEHIRAGDVYQVNYTVRSDLSLRGDPFALWSMLVQAVPMPHSAYLDCGAVQIASLSPELFLRRQGEWIESQPMKGTAKRRPSWDEDEMARLSLEASEKDRAENTMIVDLMRNDLGRICEIGTVTVPELCRAYRYPTVHQMTSTVRGRLRSDVSLFDIFAATFPPGSVTGAPKIRATQIIRDLEPEPRGVYCGTIGLFLPNGDFDCNVAIRTLEIHGARATLGIGSGIVVDSDPELEWNETLLKSHFALQRPREFGLFETFRYEPGTGFRNLHSHLRRLKNSCQYFSRPFPLRSILLTLREMKHSLGSEPRRIRLEVNGDEITSRLISEDLAWPEDGLTVMLADERLDPEDPRLYHKTTDRQEKYDALARARRQGADEVLFLNTRVEICEGAISNVMLKIGGRWLTPKLSCGLLPGVWRDAQLRSQRATEAVLTLKDLRNAEQILMGNSVRGEGNVKQVLARGTRACFFTGRLD